LTLLGRGTTLGTVSANSRLAVATHVLTMIAFAERAPAEPDPVSSEKLARSVNTNPIVVRKLLGSLRAAGLVVGHPGRHGGATLARPPGEITLADVWRAVDEPSVFGHARHRPDAACPVGSCVASLGEELRKTTIADLADRAAHLSKKPEKKKRG
jgi:DNA-binding IscR family transcriptional regulator